MTTTPRARRVVLCILAAVAAMTAACSAAETTVDPTAGPAGGPVADTPSWLFTHTATAGTFATDADGTHTLTLTGIAPHLTAFTDRPDRDASIISAERFVQSWPSMFADSAPNVVLVEHEASGDSDSFVLTLFEPRLDASTLKFTAVIVDGEDHSDQLPGLTATTYREPPAAFAITSLFIDGAEPPKVETID